MVLLIGNPQLLINLGETKISILKHITAILLCLLPAVIAQAGDSVNIGVQASMRPIGAVDPVAAQVYWNLYPDIKTNSYYGASPTRAWEHYQAHGKAEGRKWPGVTPGNIEILPYCGYPNTGGFNCIELTTDAKIQAIVWEHSVKFPNSEMLAFLYATKPDGTSQTLMSAHQFGVGDKVKPITLPEPVSLPAGTRIWIHAEGWSDESDGGFEAHVMLYFMGNAGWKVIEGVNG